VLRSLCSTAARFKRFSRRLVKYQVAEVSGWLGAACLAHVKAFWSNFVAGTGMTRYRVRREIKVAILTRRGSLGEIRKPFPGSL